jgi:hypothetical protein
VAYPEENEMLQLLAQTPPLVVEALMGSLAMVWLGRMVADHVPWKTQGQERLRVTQ